MKLSESVPLRRQKIELEIEVRPYQCSSCGKEDIGRVTNLTYAPSGVVYGEDSLQASTSRPEGWFDISGGSGREWFHRLYCPDCRVPIERALATIGITLSEGR